MICLYSLKWSVFSAWCSIRGTDLISCKISLKLSFLQELLDKRRSPSTIKVYAAAIAASHTPILGQSVGRKQLSCSFSERIKRLNPIRPFTIPTWDLHTILRALKGPPFEPLQSVDLRSLSLKTALLLVLASVKRMCDLQALSVSPTCLQRLQGHPEAKLWFCTKGDHDSIQSTGNFALCASSLR